MSGRSCREIVGELAREQVVEGLVTRMCHGSFPVDEFSQIVYFILLTLSDEVERAEAKGELRYFVVGVIQRQLRWRSSEVNKEKRYKAKRDELEEAQIQELDGAQ